MKRFFLAFLMFIGSLTFAEQTETKVDTFTSSKKKIDVLLLLALPASGKSEIRRYFSSLSPVELKESFGIGQILEIDDFIYVHMMRRISEEFVKEGLPAPYFISGFLPFKDSCEWATLMHLINEDYSDIVNKKTPKYSSAAFWLFDRLDSAREKANLAPVFKFLDPDVKRLIAKKIENEAQKIIDEKIDTASKDLSDATIIIEFSRGGPSDSTFPLPYPYGYGVALSLLDESILKNSAILYVWTTPEESRRKNEARRDPNDPGSILRHCVPLSVMYTDYGCDDIDYLISTSKIKGTINVETKGLSYNVPIGRFDNRKDKTSFLRDPISSWKDTDVQSLQKGLEKAFDLILQR